MYSIIYSIIYCKLIDTVFTVKIDKYQSAVKSGPEHITVLLISVHGHRTYTNISSSLSLQIRSCVSLLPGSSRYTTSVEQVGGDLFQGNTFQIAETGHSIPKRNLRKNGGRGIPSTSSTLVFSSSKDMFAIRSLALISRYLAKLLTRPPKVGNNLNQPAIEEIIRS